jgi:hypothetical protein
MDDHIGIGWWTGWSKTPGRDGISGTTIGSWKAASDSLVGVLTSSIVMTRSSPELETMATLLTRASDGFGSFEGARGETKKYQAAVTRLSAKVINKKRRRPYLCNKFSPDPCCLSARSVSGKSPASDGPGPQSCAFGRTFIRYSPTEATSALISMQAELGLGRTSHWTISRRTHNQNPHGL